MTDQTTTCSRCAALLGEVDDWKRLYQGLARAITKAQATPVKVTYTSRPEKPRSVTPDPEAAQ